MKPARAHVREKRGPITSFHSERNAHVSELIGKHFGNASAQFERRRLEAELDSGSRARPVRIGKAGLIQQFAGKGGVVARQGNLARDTVVGTAMTNLGLELALQKKGISMLRADVGDRYVV